MTFNCYYCKKLIINIRGTSKCQSLKIKNLHYLPQLGAIFQIINQGFIHKTHKTHKHNAIKDSEYSDRFKAASSEN